MDNPDPLENRPSAIKALYRNYEQRVEEVKKRARRFMNFNFILLGLAVFAVIYAPYLAIDDIKIYRQELIDSNEENKSEQQETEKERSDFPILLVQIDFLRIGLLTVLILMSQHMIKLARYNFRLMTFYRARQDVLLMTTAEALPWSKLTPEDLEQAANALSPDHVDPEFPPKNPMEMLRQRASWRIKQTPGQ